MVLNTLKPAVLAAAIATCVGAMAAQSFVAPAAHAQMSPFTGPGSVADLAEGLLESVVNISTSQNVSGNDESGVNPPQMPDGSPFQDLFEDYFSNPGGGSPRAQKVQSLGSGFVLDAEQGIIITNNHVIADADEIEVNFSDGSKLKATLKGRDTKTDIAVLQVDTSRKKLKAVRFGDSDTVRVGDWVMAIGNPFGLGGSVTLGIVSARNRDINSGPYDDFIQTDAAINRGNSGGPLFNMKGEVVGINTAIISPSGGSIGIGFSIPAKLAAGVVEQLREHGQTFRGWLGVRIQEVSEEIAESLGMDTPKGALVSGIVKGGPVDDGSILAGDVIVRFDGRELKAMNDLPRAVAESPVGEEVDVVVVRDGKEITVKVTLGRLEDGERLAEGAPAAEDTGDAPAVAAGANVLGMTLREIDAEQRERFGIADEVSGVVVIEVAPNSAAAQKGIVAGDVITEIAQEAVRSPKQVTDRITALRGQGRKSALLMLASKDGALRFIPVPMN